jgi:homoserine kinase
MRVVAPASTANLGPGFDSAAAALDLWNEVTVDQAEGSVEIEGEGADELSRDSTHLTLRAFSLFASPEGYSFRFVNRIPLERGLGSSAAAVALGLVAGAAAVGREVTAAQLLEAGEELEGHPDNLAAALYGGVCVAWKRDGHPFAAQIATDLPLTPILTIPAARTSTAASRDGLPSTVSHEDAAANAASALLLGAAIASGNADLLRASFYDRLHEQYRYESAPLLDELRRRVPAGSGGVTLSGSGPSVVVWAEHERVVGVVTDLERNLPPDTLVLPLAVAREGARIV